MFVCFFCVDWITITPVKLYTGILFYSSILLYVDLHLLDLLSPFVVSRKQDLMFLKGPISFLLLFLETSRVLVSPGYMRKTITELVLP